MPGVVLFDLDGTLTDSAPGMIGGLRYAADRHGLAWPSDEIVQSFLGPPLMDTFTGHFEMTAEDATAAIETYREYYHATGLFENRVYEGIPELLAALHDRGLTLAVSTSKPTPSATRILERFELAPHFNFIGGATLDGSRQHKAEVIEHTLEALGSPDGTITMIGDRAHDVLGAAAFGIPTIGVDWGYGTPHELTEAGAFAVASTPAEVLNVIALRHLRE
jgi:phosphoglycolate phosphatase